MATTPLLNIPQVSASQNNKETTINDAFVIFEGSTNASLTVDMTAGDVALTTFQFTRYGRFKVENLPAAQKLTIPLDVGGGANTAQRIFAVFNDSSYELTVGGATGATVAVSPGKGALLASDGTDVTYTTSSDGSSSSTAFTVQDDGVVVSAAVDTLNFVGAEFTITDLGGGSIQIEVSGGGGGGSVAVEEGDVEVSAAVSVLDFAGSDFNIVNEGSGEVRIELADPVLNGNTVGSSGNILDLQYAPPSTGDFSTVGTTVVESSLPEQLTISAAPDSDRINGYLRNIPAGDFTVTTRVISDAHNNYNGAGVILKDTDGKYAVIAQYWNGGNSVEVQNWVDETTFSTGSFGSVQIGPQARYLRFTYIGGVITYYYSQDGFYWILMGVDSTLGTLESYGFGISSRSASNGVVAGFQYWKDGGNSDGVNQAVVDVYASTVKVDDVVLNNAITSLDFKGTDFNIIEQGTNEVLIEVNDTASINTQAGDYQLTVADAKRTMIRMTSSSANNLTVPTNATAAIPIGSVVTVRQAGSGQTTIVAAGGVTVNTPETLLLRKQGSSASLIKVGTDEWDLTGDLEAI